MDEGHVLGVEEFRRSVKRLLPWLLGLAGLLGVGSVFPSLIEPFCNDVMIWSGILVPFLAGSAGLWIYCKLLSSELATAQRQGWCLVCIGLLAWSLGQGLHILGTPPLRPGVADVLYLGARLLLIAGMLLLFGRCSGIRRLRILLDSLLAASAIGLVCWYFACLGAGRLPLARREELLALAYVAGDVVLIFLALKLLQWQWQRPGGKKTMRTVVLLLAGCVLFGGRDLLFFRHVAYGLPQSNLWVEWMRTGGLMAIGLAVISSWLWPELAGMTDAAGMKTSTGWRRETEGWWAEKEELWAVFCSLFPYLLGGAAFGLVWGWNMWFVDARHRVELTMVSLAAVLVLMIRQAILLWENRLLHQQLRGHLAAQSRQGAALKETMERQVQQALERRVRERTAELEAAASWQRLAMKESRIDLWDWDVVLDRLTGRWWVEILGFTPGEKTDTLAEWTASLHPADRERVRQAMAEHVSGRTSRLVVDVRMVAKDGTIRWVQVSGAAVSRDADKRALRVVGVLMDVTERRETEERLMSAQKLEWLEKLSGVVAHDFNNFRMVVNGYADLMLAKLPDNDPLVCDIEAIRTVGMDAAAIVRQHLLDVSRK